MLSRQLPVLLRPDSFTALAWSVQMSILMLSRLTMIACSRMNMALGYGMGTCISELLILY